MAAQRKQFPFSEFEPHWQQHWLKEGAFTAKSPGDSGFDPAQPKYYVLDMFPYPSGDGLHVGHVEGYTATDIISRFKRMRGFNVLHPMGWDAFGLPAEQFAIKTGQHPRVTTERNVTRFRSQLQALGFSYDWSREISTTDPGYFRWTQWIFLQLYNSWLNPLTNKAEPISTFKGTNPDKVRLAYVAEMPVNWCPELGTVLANEEVIDGKSEVGGHPVERRPLRQWMLRITAFAERLISELDGLDWPDGIKLLQKNWIGRSDGARVTFTIFNTRHAVEVFTTRPDTLFGATYMVLSPEHPHIAKITTAPNRAAVEAYQKEVSSKSDRDRADPSRPKTGVFTGAFAMNPVNSELLPVWIADYVLLGYGTGAIMAVPAHDERDAAFAEKFNLKIRPVIEPLSEGTNDAPASAPDPGALQKNDVGTPTWNPDANPHFATFRLTDSLSPKILGELTSEESVLLEKAESGDFLSAEEADRWKAFYLDRIDPALNAAHGTCILRDAKVADLVENAFRHFDGKKYHLLAWCVMPNHVHALFTPLADHDPADIVNSWKSLTGYAANKILGRQTEFWQKDVYEHGLTSEDEFKARLKQILHDPENAGLEDWKYRDVKGSVARKQSTATTCHTGEGIMINSRFLDGQTSEEARETITAWLVGKHLGRPAVNYKLRDWLFSRQRYWGEPFPIVWEDGRHRALEESELPVIQPEMDDFKPTGTAEPPLSKATDWLRYSEKATRETNTMPQWAGSCWYYLRFCDAKNSSRFVGEEAEKYWMTGEHPETKSALPGGVDLYVGGTEHAVLHLLYARFWHKVLFDLGQVSTPEPFQRLVNQGIILGPDNQKMSKSRGNVVTPDTVISEYGADALRLYEMFMGPLEQMKPWSMKGVEGVYRFLARVWRLAMEETQEGTWKISSDLTETDLTPSQLRVVHASIKKVSEDFEALAFNTALAQLMVFTNEFVKTTPRPVAALRVLLPLLSPLAPHMAEELWTRLSEKFPQFEGRASTQPWPTYDEKFLVIDEVEYAVQVNGKVRDHLTVSAKLEDAAVEAAALAAPKIKEATEGKSIVKVIVVRGKLVNIVVK